MFQTGFVDIFYADEIILGMILHTIRKTNNNKRASVCSSGN